MNNSLRILGCYSGSGGYRRYPSSQLLILNNKNYLVDCGEGTQFLLKKYKTKLNSIDNIFISHLHGDHYFGLPGLISHYNLKGRAKDLSIYGPIGLKKIILLIMKSSNSWTSYKLNIIELEPKDLTFIDNDKISVSSIKLSHRIPCTGFVFKLKKNNSNIKALQKLIIEQVKTIFERITDEDVNVLGFSDTWCRPEWFVCSVFPIAPPAVRPSAKQSDSQRMDDDLTHKLSDLSLIHI